MSNLSKSDAEKAPNARSNSGPSSLERGIFFVAALVMPIVGLGALVLSFSPGETWETRGQIGDFFGPLTSMLNLAALLFMAASHQMQRRELELQRDELASQRAEQEKQTDALARLDNTLNVMSIRNHF